MATTKKPADEPVADELDPNLPAAAGKKDPVSPAVPPVPSTPVDIPANEPYPTGAPKEQSWAEINGLTPPPAE